MTNAAVSRVGRARGPSRVVSVAALPHQFLNHIGRSRGIARHVDGITSGNEDVVFNSHAYVPPSFVHVGRRSDVDAGLDGYYRTRT